MDQIKNLKYLNLAANQINDLSAVKFPAKLKYLELQQNSIVKVPETIFKSKNLEFLNASQNNIKEISPKVKWLKNVVSMNLANNQLKELPKELSYLKNLKTLILTGNPLDQSTVEKLKALMPQTQIYF